MAQKTIVYWRDIPAQVLVKAGRKTARRELPARFIQAIDRCAIARALRLNVMIQSGLQRLVRAS